MGRTKKGNANSNRNDNAKNRMDHEITSYAEVEAEKANSKKKH